METISSLLALCEENSPVYFWYWVSTKIKILGQNPWYLQRYVQETAVKTSLSSTPIGRQRFAEDGFVEY